MSRLAHIAGGSVALAACLGLALAAPAAADPPGDNGTVKIDGVAFDTHPDNEPHVGCRFQVDFYGFDMGDLNAAVTFEGQAPTGKDTPLLWDSVFIGEDAAGGGTDLDAEVTYNLANVISQLGAPHPIQGYHIKLTVNAEGSIGADTKHKVFWVTGCQPPS
ncbi:hypothetical protein [uncultured Microbacterium sp.]|nr:hypothetical protein [uncultured Microbacterium sp.]